MTMMKTAILIGALAFVTGCGSSKKKEEAAATPTPTPTATAPVAETKAEKMKGEKKMTRPAKAAVNSDPNAREVKCSAGGDERLLAVSAQGEGCELKYTKAGETKIIATQVVGDGRCVEVMGNVKKNLEGAQFACQ